MAECILVAEHVTFSYPGSGGPVEALHDITVGVAQGEHLALTGASGSGKSTLLGLLGLLAAPTAGRVIVMGQDGGSMSARHRSRVRREQMGFVFQQFHLLSALDATTNVELSLRLRGMTTADRLARARECLEWVGLQHRASHRPLELSGGEQQRVALARAIAPRPRIVLADEPTGNLDAANRDKLLELFDRLHQAGTTIVTVTHDPLVAGQASRTINVDNGRLSP